MKTCSRCRQDKPAEDFHRDNSRPDGLQRTCKPCKTVEARERYRADPAAYAAKQRAWSSANPDAVRAIRARQERDPAHVAARRLVHEEIRTGRMVRPVECEQCKTARPTHAHHEDYSRPLDVMFLCEPCHLAVHGKVTRRPEPVSA